MKEIERKFLVKANFKQDVQSVIDIKQAYLSLDFERIVRIRLVDDKGFLTIKGQSTDNGLSRFEWEKELSLQEAEELYKLRLPGCIEKKRYFVNFKNQLFEVDEFLGDNKGLVLAELELESCTQKIELPNWIDKEVTGDKRYYNSYLISNPFKLWLFNKK